VFTGQKGQISIEHIKVFSCKCYSYVNLKSLPAEGRKDKLVLQGRTCMFMGYVDKTTKQYKVYMPDLQATVRASVVDFEEKTKGGTVDLNLLGEYLQGTPNVLTVCKPIGRPKELPLPTVDLPPQEKLNNFDIVIPLQTPEGIIQSTDVPAKLPAKELEPVESVNLPKSQNKTPEQAVSQEQPIPWPQTPVTGLYNLRKHNQNQEDEPAEPAKPNNRIAKRIRAMLALLEQEDFDLDNQETAFAASTKGKEIVQIPIPKSYSSAVRDLIYRPEWRAAIQEEIASLQANNT